MKKANVYLLAYIVFLFICLFISRTYNFPMWTRIVVGITNSSFFFAIADGFQFFADEWEELYLENDKSICRIKENILTIRATEVQNKSEANGQELDYLGKSIEEISKLNSKVSKDIIILRCIAKVSICAGFLMFLCVLTFAEVFDYLFPRQETVTVCGFLCVLLLQFLRPILQEISRKSLMKLENRTDRLIESMNQLFEEATHAD